MPSDLPLSPSAATLAARAATLAERFGATWTPVASEEGEARARTLWARWETLLPGGGEAALAARLALSGWEPAAARARLGAGRWHEQAPLPCWTKRWEAVRRHFTTPATAHAAGAGGWAGWSQPFVAEGRALLDPTLPEPLHAEACRLLAAWIETTSTPTLEFELGLFRSAALLVDRPGDREDFVAELAQTRAALLEANYPVLIRLCCGIVDAIAATWNELGARLSGDAAGLAARFNRGRALGVVTACRGGLSDPHRGGRTAVELRFASGTHLVYKPRSLAAEAGYFALLDWLHARGARPRQRTVATWHRGDYGWMEWIDPVPCCDGAAASRHFVRTGAQLALLHVLGGADFHAENWIAAGEFPVPIDLEVMLRPGLAKGAGELEQTVLSVGLLPTWLPTGGKAADISALGGEGIRSDGPHRPRLRGKPLAAAHYAREIERGFRAMHTLLRRQRTALLRAGSPLAALRTARVRHVARPTEVYGRVLRAAAQPAALRDGATYSLELERVAKALASLGPTEAALIPAEIAALARIDVPLLQMRASSRQLETDAGNLPRFFIASGWTTLRRRLASLSPAETHRQAALIRSAFAVATLGGTADEAHSTRRAAPRALRPAKPATSRELLAAAVEVGRQLADQAAPTGNGLTWLAPQLLPRAGRFQLKPLDAVLYDGAAGVGLFLAALHRATGDAVWAVLARQTFTPLSIALADARGERRHLRRLPPGAGLGRAGIVYALTHGARWLRSARWQAPTLRLADLLLPQPHDTDIDLLSGAAGAALVALSPTVSETLPQSRSSALVWGERLLAAQAADGSWPHDGAALGGFSHGASGPSAALARLAAATGDGRFSAAAARGLAYEATLFSPERGNWLDLRGDARAARQARRCTLAWCHGAPGILLARLACIGIVDTPALEADIGHALRAIADAPTPLIDHCCCGEAGLIDILETAAAALRRPELAALARARAGALLAKARAAGGYNAYGSVALPAGPGFFQGLAGIGYTWLRLAQPGRFPSVLALA